MAAPAKSSPRDAQVMAAILKDMGVTDYEPRVINQMLEFVYHMGKAFISAPSNFGTCYVTDVLEDAKVYSSHCSKKAIDVEDVKLAVQCRMDQSFTSPPPKDLLMEISKHKNSQVLPLIKPYCGLRLPPDRYCLSAPNYKVACQKVMKKHQPRIQIGLPMNQFHQRININQMTHGIPTGKVGHPGSGNTTLAVVTKNMTIPTVTIVTKPSQPQGAPLIKPSIKLSTGPALNSLNQNKSFATTPHIQTQPSIQNLSQTSLHSQQQLSILNQHQSSIHIQPLSSSTSSLITSQANPLKRKLEDDDYDNPS